jgi:hypothetical protein
MAKPYSREYNNQVHECITKIHAPVKVFTLQFMCMETINQRMENNIKQNLTETRKDFGLEYMYGCMDYRKGRLFDLIATFYLTRRLKFTPFVYLFMINMRDELVTISLDTPKFIGERREPQYRVHIDTYLDMIQNNPEQGIQVRATKRYFTNEPHNDDFRFRDDVYWLEYVQYPMWVNNSWSWANKQYGPDPYCNEDAWRDHSMHRERLSAYEMYQKPPLNSPLDPPPFEQPPIGQSQQATTTVDSPEPLTTAIDPASQPGTPKTPRRVRNALFKALKEN